MKTKLFLLCMIAAALASCEGPMGPQGEPGAPGEGVNWKILYYTVRANDWHLVGGENELNSYYMYEFDEPELSDFIYESGNVLGYIILNSGKSNETLSPLPYNIALGEGSGSNEFLWTENYFFDYMPGSVAFFVYYSDFNTEIKPPTCEFRLVMNW